MYFCLLLNSLLISEQIFRSGSSVWLERLTVTQEVASSSLVRSALKPAIMRALLFQTKLIYLLITLLVSYICQNIIHERKSFKAS